MRLGGRAASAAFALLVPLAWPLAARAQASAHSPLVVALRVTDSAGVAIDGANAVVVRGLSEVQASATTDARGRASLTIPAAEGDYQLIVRRIGFFRADQFFRAGATPMAFTVVMQPTAQALAPVKVSATEDLKRKSYFIDADEIAKHADELIDATDILRKLKPDMICGRECSPLGSVAATTRAPTRNCPQLAFHQRPCPRAAPAPATAVGATNVWVNGVWIRQIAYEPVSPCQIGHRGMLAGLMPGSMQVLCEILPEHIEQITYLDQYDTSIGKPHSEASIYVVLKPGVAYEPGKMSYVVSESTTKHRSSAAQAVRPDTAVVADSSAPRDSLAALPPYRFRVLGVFDLETGEPIEAARVFDTKTGTYVNTTATGTVSLVFLPEGGSLVRVTKAGYEDLTVAVEIAPANTVPLTLLMKRRAAVPPADREPERAHD